MNIPEEFGKYLLLKKLTEDPLGETFRAGRVGTDGIEQVVLLRVFNGKGMDGEKLWQQVSGRNTVQQALRSPNIGTGVDLGRVRSYPYAAYDYISGKNLATLFAQATKQFSPIPTDHALLIAERIGLALAAAYETKVQDQRVQHGFVMPHLVMISNEGETRLLGFEVAPGLRALAAAGWSDPDTAPYLSPETAEGGAVGKSDDVWSLGAILFELLTGERLPAAAPADGYGGLIDRAVLANEGTPLPPAIVALLKKSLVARDQRIADAVTWHKTLSKLMIDGHYSPTTFNLAFFMHNLFRDEIERESQEIQAEKKLELPHRQAAPVAPVPVPAPAAADMREKTGVREHTLSGTGARGPAAQAAKPSKMPLFIGLAAAVLVGVGIGAWLLFGRSGPEPAAQQAAGTAPMTQPAAVPVNPQQAPAPAGPTQEELQAQIKAMVAEQSKALDDKYKADYEERIKQLQKQVEERQRRDEQAAKAEPRPSIPSPAVEEPTPAPVKPAETPAPPPVNTQPAQQAPAPVVEQKPAPAQTASSNPPAASAPPSAAPARKQVQYGDLVTTGEPGVTPPKLKGRLDPRYPQAAQRMNKAAVVDVKVLVDEKGKVLEAERVGPKAGFGFDESALDAARRALFQPASTRDGVRVKMWYTVRVSFQPAK